MQMNRYSSNDWMAVDESRLPPWVKRIAQRAKEIGCDVFFDPKQHWSESSYFRTVEGKRYILAGGRGRYAYCCTVLVHEVAHAILDARNQHPKDFVRGEEAAWELAAQIAQEEALPLISKIRRRGLHAYRQARQQKQVSGSKGSERRKRPNQIALRITRLIEDVESGVDFLIARRAKYVAKSNPMPKTGQLTQSRRSTAAQCPPDAYPIGKKGRRKTKRDVKRSTAKAERRAAREDCHLYSDS